VRLCTGHRYVLLQSVLSLSVFIPGNAGQHETTALQRLVVLGTPVPQEGSRPTDEQQQSAANSDWLNSR
jgi:hypothetical protein